MAQIEEDDLKNYNLTRFNCEDPFFMEIFALKVDDAGYMVFPGHTLVCKERVCLGGLWVYLPEFTIVCPAITVSAVPL